MPLCMIFVLPAHGTATQQAQHFRAASVGTAALLAVSAHVTGCEHRRLCTECSPNSAAGMHAAQLSRAHDALAGGLDRTGVLASLFLLKQAVSQAPTHNRLAALNCRPALPAACGTAYAAQACHAVAPSHSKLCPARLLAVTAATRPPPPAPLFALLRVLCPTLHPQVTDIRLITDRHTKRSKGLAYIEFSKQEEVFAALTLTGQVCCRRLWTTPRLFLQHGKAARTVAV